jgi:hypothetical protein
MGLLREDTEGGSPRDYLLARIRGRRAYLITEWRQILAAAQPLASLPPSPYRQLPGDNREEGIWSGLQREVAWIHHQMEPTMRALFAPLFLNFELRTLILALRMRVSDERRNCADILRYSLLSGSVKKILIDEADSDAIVAGLSSHLDFLPGSGQALLLGYHNRGVAGYEEELVSACLEHAARSPLHPVIGKYFRSLIDMKNIISLSKLLRWRIAPICRFVWGGSITPPLLLAAAAERETGQARRLLARLLGSESDPAATIELVPLLTSWLGRIVRRLGRESGDIGLILDYLWRRQHETRNLSLILHGLDIDPEALERELAQ